MTEHSMWNRSAVIGLAKASCTFCHGAGLRPSLRLGDVPCNCVFRAIFRICYRRYRECEAMAAHTNGIRVERGAGPSGYRLYSRRQQEYAADFALVGRRVLSSTDYDLFHLHYLLEADWRVCCHDLHLGRGAFFHRAYEIAERLGRAFAELRPYPLYPVAGYFEGVAQSRRAGPPPVALRWNVREVVPHR